VNSVFFQNPDNYYSQHVSISKVMLKSLILGSSIALLSALSLPAIATDWQTTGVSTRTRETVAIDMDSIDRSNGKYDVRFRYLIGKDLVKASVNCDSSLVTPDQGKPFVPDMTGATREMIKLACGGNSGSSGTSYDRGYGDGDRRVNSASISSYASGIDARGFWVNDIAITSVRSFLRGRGNRYHAISLSKLADDMGLYCESRSQGYSRDQYLHLVVQALSGTSDYTAYPIIEYQGSLMGAAERYVCPQYKD
jgi:hypothetical protein